MIPFEGALLFWIPVSCLLMMDRDSARGFSLALILGLMLLPSGAKIELPGVPDLSRDTVVIIGVFIGTVIFHPEVFDRFKFGLPDLLLLAVLQATFVTSYFNDFGVYDGISQSIGILIEFILPIFLARLHLGTMKSIRTFLLVLVGASVFYAPFALVEFRMSPQIHIKTYGYFQHVFQQHYRGGFWRPIVFFSHALALGRFFAFTAFLAMLPMRKDLVTMLGKVGHFVFLAPLCGLVLSQSFGPYLLFCLLCSGYFVIRANTLVAYAIPILALCWLLAVIAGFRPGYGSTSSIAQLNEDRAGSLQYRLDALQEYRSMILYRPWLGHGNWDKGRISGRATDSQGMIQLLTGGLVGAAFYYAWWLCLLHTALQVVRWSRGTVFNQRAAAIAILASLCIAVTSIDAALDLHVLVLLSALYPIYGWLRSSPRPEGVSGYVRAGAQTAH